MMAQGHSHHIKCSCGTTVVIPPFRLTHQCGQCKKMVVLPVFDAAQLLGKRK